MLKEVAFFNFALKFQFHQKVTYFCKNVTKWHTLYDLFNLNLQEININLN